MTQFRKFISLEQGSDDWHQLRNTKIGASDAPIIMGVSPWMTPYQLWQIKVGLEPPIATTDAMRRGTELEPMVRDHVNKFTNMNFQPAVAISSTHAYMMASLDGYDEEDETILEIKCPGKQDHEIAKKGLIPEKYRYQLLHQMFTTNIYKVLYVSYNSEDFQYVDIGIEDFSKEEQIILLKKEYEFYTCMKNLIPPALTDRDYIIKNDCLWESYSTCLKNCENLIRGAEEEREYFKNKLIELSEGKNCTGSGITVQHISRKGAVKYDEIPELANVDLEKYRSEGSTYQKITIK